MTKSQTKSISQVVLGVVMFFALTAVVRPPVSNAGGDYQTVSNIDLSLEKLKKIVTDAKSISSAAAHAVRSDGKIHVFVQDKMDSTKINEIAFDKDEFIVEKFESRFQKVQVIPTHQEVTTLKSPEYTVNVYYPKDYIDHDGAIRKNTHYEETVQVHGDYLSKYHGKILDPCYDDSKRGNGSGCGGLNYNLHLFRESVLKVKNLPYLEIILSHLKSIADEVPLEFPGKYFASIEADGVSVGEIGTLKWTGHRKYRPQVSPYEIGEFPQPEHGETERGLQGFVSSDSSEGKSSLHQIFQNLVVDLENHYRATELAYMQDLLNQLTEIQGKWRVTRFRRRMDAENTNKIQGELITLISNRTGMMDNYESLEPRAVTADLKRRVEALSQPKGDGSSGGAVAASAE